MRGLYQRLAPFTPDSSGAIAAFSDVAAIVVPVDMNGTVSTFRGRVGLDEGAPLKVCSSLGSRELSYIMGDDEAFLSSFSEVVDSQGGDFAVLLHGPISSIVGVHLENLAARLEERVLMPVLAVDCSGARFYDAGLAEAYSAIFKRAREMMPRVLPHRANTVNILGLNSVDHNDARLRWLLAEGILSATGSRAVSYWGCFGGWGEWCYAGAAERNIVASASAYKLAREMKRAWGTPYVFLDELPLPLVDDGMAKRLAQAACGKRVLIVGEQLLGNSLRRVLEGGLDEGDGADGADQAFGGIVVASFFSLVRERRRGCDLHLASEREACELVNSGEFDLLVADEAVCRLASPRTPWIDLPHSAVMTPMRRDPSGTACAFSPAWFEQLAQLLEQGGRS